MANPTIPATGPGGTISRSDLQGTFGLYQTLLPGTTPATAIVVNPFPASETPAYTSGNTTEAMFGSGSNSNLASMWGFLDGGTQHDGVSGYVRSIPATSVTQLNGVFGYGDNANTNNTTTKVGVVVGVGSGVVNRVDGAQSWAWASIAVDTGTGGAKGRLMQSEWDWKPAFANTAVAANANVLSATVQPTNARANGVGSTNGFTWTSAINSGDGMVQWFAEIGMVAAAGAASSNSQPVKFHTSTTSGAQHWNQIHAADTAFVFDRDDGGQCDLNVSNGNLLLQAGHVVDVAGIQVVSARQTGWFAPGGTLSRSALVPGTATTTTITQTLNALITDLFTHGLIGG